MIASDGGLAFEITADLAKLEPSLKRADTAVSTAAGRMSANLDKVERSSESAVRASDRLRDGYGRAANAADGAVTATGRMAAANDNAARSFERMSGLATNGASRVTAYTGALSGAALGVAALGVGMLGAAAAIARAGDEFTGYRNKLLTAGEDQSTLNKRLSELTDIALRSRTGLQPVIELYSGISKSTQELGKTQAEAARVTETISKAFAASGASAASASGAILQLNQAFAAGALRGDELNSVLEGAPSLARLIAKEFGIGIGELKTFGEEGKLSADKVFNAFLNGSKEIDSTFNATAQTISQASTNAGTALSQLGADLDNLVGFAQRAVAGLNAVAGAVQAVSAKIASFQDGVQKARLDNLRNTIEGLEQTEIPFLTSARDTKGVKEATENLVRFRAEYDKITTARIDSMVAKPADIALNTEGMITTARATRTAQKALEDLAKAETDVARGAMTAVEKATVDANKAFEERSKVAKQMRLDGVENAKISNYEARSQKILADTIKNANEASAKKGGGRSASSSGTDAYDNATARIRDQIEELKLQADAASKTTVEVYRLTEANRLRRAANQAGRGDEAGIAEDIERTAEAYAKQRAATEAAIEAQRRYQESIRETADGISDLIKDLMGGKGFDAALKSFGSKLTEQALDGLLTGKGQIGSALGLAPTTKGGTGGLIGALLGQDTGFFRQMTKAVESGSSDGVFSGFGSLFGNSSTTSGFATMAQGGMGPEQSGGLSLGGFGGMGMGALGSAVAGYSSGSPMMGALSGALMGFTASGGNPIGAVLGALAGAGGGVIGGKSKTRKEILHERAQRLRLA